MEENDLIIYCHSDWHADELPHPFAMPEMKLLSHHDKPIPCATQENQLPETEEVDWSGGESSSRSGGLRRWWMARVFPLWFTQATDGMRICF